MIFAVLDTLKFANSLKAAGVPDDQAEVRALMIGELMKVYPGECATNTELRREVEILRSELHALQARSA